MLCESSGLFLCVSAYKFAVKHSATSRIKYQQNLSEMYCEVAKLTLKSILGNQVQPAHLVLRPEQSTHSGCHIGCCMSVALIVSTYAILLCVRPGMWDGSCLSCCHPSCTVMVNIFQEALFGHWAMNCPSLHKLCCHHHLSA